LLFNGSKPEMTYSDLATNCRVKLACNVAFRSERKEYCIHKEATTKLVHALCTAAMKLANKRPWLIYRDLTAVDRSASLLKERHQFISVD
jgi:hypothetical protein